MPHIVQLTPPGRGAVATLRVEGDGALAVVQSHFRARGGRLLKSFSPDRLVVGHFGGDRGEEVVVRRCRDDAVELHCHGGLAAVATIEAALIAAGCRRVAWRDWSAARHADPPLATAALAALADAATERTASILLDQYHGALNRAMCDIRQAIDLGNHEAARQQIDALLARAEFGRHLVRPWRVVLAGRVNVGKSSLINAMAGYGRSIVHPMPGTTRDAVTLATAIDGWPIELCDTAGLRGGGSECSATDAVERAGIERTHERLAQADLVILVFDGSMPWLSEDQALCNQSPQALLVYNKCDLLAASESEHPAMFSLENSRGLTAPGELHTIRTSHCNPSVPAPGAVSPRLFLFTSALHGVGIDDLWDGIARRLVPDPPPPGEAVPFTAEQIEAIAGMGRACCPSFLE